MLGVAGLGRVAGASPGPPEPAESKNHLNPAQMRQSKVNDKFLL